MYTITHEWKAIHVTLENPDSSLQLNSLKVLFVLHFSYNYTVWTENICATILYTICAICATLLYFSHEWPVSILYMYGQDNYTPTVQHLRPMTKLHHLSLIFCLQCLCTIILIASSVPTEIFDAIIFIINISSIFRIFSGATFNLLTGFILILTAGQG